MFTVSTHICWSSLKLLYRLVHTFYSAGHWTPYYSNIWQLLHFAVVSFSPSYKKKKQQLINNYINKTWQSKNCKQGFLSALSLNLSLNLSLPNWNRNVYIDYSVVLDNLTLTNLQHPVNSHGCPRHNFL